MKKKEIISKIKTCVENNGGSIEMFELGTSVWLSSIGNSEKQAETFYPETFEAFNYYMGNEESSETMSYSELKKNKLKEILALLEKFVPEEE